METKSAPSGMYVANTVSNLVVETITEYCCSGILAPFSINGTNARIVNDVIEYYGFLIGDVISGAT